MSIGSASGKVTVSSEKPEKRGNAFADVVSGASSVAIVYDKNATAQTILAAKELLGILRTLDADMYLVREDELNEGEYVFEILFGMTEAEESLEFINSLGYNEYGIKVSGNRIAFVGWTEEAAALAYATIYEMVEHAFLNGTASCFDGAVYTGELSDLVYDEALRLDDLDSITDVGEGAYMLYKLTSSKDDYEAYCEKLKAAGYALHTTNTINTVLFATYYNEDIVINVQYGGDNERSLRIVIEPMANTTLPMLAPPEDANSDVTGSSISMLDHPNVADGNLCLVIQLSNGHFIIVDSNTNGTQKGISDFLKAKAPDGKPVIEAWILTHFHQDHIGGFIDFVSNSRCMRDVTIKSIIYNFPQRQVLSTAPGATDQGNIAKFPIRLEKTGATVYQARTGQKYYFGNAEVEILWTYEDIMPHNVFTDRTNPTCIGFSITIEGQKIMVTGDTSAEEFTAAYKKFGAYLKSDFVQLSHHGYGDGGSPNEFYEFVDAPYVLNSGMGKSYGAAERWAKDNAEKYFLRDELGTCTIPLPYNGGEFEFEMGQ